MGQALKNQFDYFLTRDELEQRRLSLHGTARQIQEAYWRLPAIEPPHWKALVTSWEYALGRQEEGLNTSLESLPKTRVKVSLPQRLLHPDTPYWYVGRVALATDSVVEIGADDGAQLYVDGVRIPITGDYFFVSASPHGSEWVVRVLNKAAYGGLEWLRVAEREDFLRYDKESGFRARLSRLIHKILSLRHPNDELFLAIQDAIGYCTEETLLKAEALLVELPCCLVGPLLQKPTTHSIAVVWETDIPCTASLRLEEPNTLSMARTEDGTLHRVELTDLQPNTLYTYRLLNGTVLSAPFSFRTLPTEEPFAFTAWADAQVNASCSKNRDVFQQNIHLLRSLPMAFTIGVGDLVENGNRREPWIHFFDRLTPLASQIPTLLVGGNHEYDGCFETMRSPYLERYIHAEPSPHYYAWSVGSARCIALDPNIHFPTGIPEGSEEHIWLMNELNSAEWRQATWHFLFIHQPPYSQGWQDYEGDLPIRALFEPLYEPFGIDFVISGHTHDYEHLERCYGSQKVQFLILGGAGGGMEEGEVMPEPKMDRLLRRHHIGQFLVERESVTFRAIATDSRILDSFVVRK